MKLSLFVALLVVGLAAAMSEESGGPQPPATNFEAPVNNDDIQGDEQRWGGWGGWGRPWGGYGGYGGWGGYGGYGGYGGWGRPWGGYGWGRPWYG